MGVCAFEGVLSDLSDPYSFFFRFVQLYSAEVSFFLEESVGGGEAIRFLLVPPNPILILNPSTSIVRATH